MSQGICNSKITIGIPTAGRPKMLRSALQSVANQTRLDLISEILVSENGGDHQSFDICQEFPELPIRYVFQKTPLKPYAHFLRVVETLKEDWVALLGDDDMWGRYHLEEAFRALSENEDVIGFAGQAVIVGNESRQVQSGYTRLLASVQEGGTETFAPYWRWTAGDLLIESLSRTPLNLWALVCRRAELLRAMQIFRQDELGLDADRLMWWELARQGTLVVGREVSLFYRLHPNSGCGMLQKSNPVFHNQKAAEYTKQMIVEAEQDGIDWKQLWVNTWNKLSSSHQAFIWRHSIEGTKSVLKIHLDKICHFPEPIIRSPRGKFLVRFVPPVVIDGVRRLLGRL